MGRVTSDLAAPYGPVRANDRDEQARPADQLQPVPGMGPEARHLEQLLVRELLGQLLDQFMT